MPVYNNPGIGAAFGSLADIFKPPSGSDAAGWAVANAKRAEAARIAELYQGAAGDADRQGVIAGLYAPTQSYYAVDQNNAVARRGQDIDSGDKRYGIDTGARTALTTNAADNARAIATNAATVAGGIQQARIGGLADMFGPLSEGQVRPALPAEIAAQFGAPGAPGAIEQAEGRVKLPTSDEVIGAAMLGMGPEAVDQFARDKFAPSATQVEGQERRALRATGQLSDQDVLDAITGAETPVQVLGPDGKTPVYSTPGAAARTGAPAFVNKGAEAAPQFRNYQTQDGRNGNAIYDQGRGTWVDTTSRVPLPEGATLYTGELSGSGSETGFGAQKPNLVAATNLEASLDSAQQLVDGMRETLRSNPNVAGVPGRVKGILQSLTSSAQQIAGAYAEVAPEAIVTLDEVQREMAKAIPGGVGYDPSIVRLQSNIYDLAYMRAQINNPTGEVSRQAFERALESLGQSVLSSQQDLSTALDAFEQDTIGVNRTKVQSLRGQRGDVAPLGAMAGAPAVPAPAASAERWERGPDGKLRKVQ